MTATKEKQAIPPALMLRIRACGLIFQHEKPGKIKAIAARKGISLEEAGIAYTIGCIRRMKQSGTARNYREGLGFLEARQVGDRGDNLNPPNGLARIVDKIDCVNKGNTYNPDYITGSIAFTAIIDSKTVYGPMAGGMAHYPVNKPEEIRRHSRKMGKVYGSLYTQWEAVKEESTPHSELEKKEKAAIHAEKDKRLRLFFTEYADHLSPVLRTRIQEIIACHESSTYLASRKGRENVDTKSIARAAENLFSNFPYKEDLTRREYIDLIRKYIPLMA